jgi:S1-C subfamily serine protease
LNTSGFGRVVNLTIPAKFAWKIADKLSNDGSVTCGFLGIRSQEVELNSEAQTALGRYQVSGLLVISVEKDSPAEAARLLVGDNLVGLNRKPVSDHDMLFMALAGASVGKSILVEVLRSGQPETVSMTIGERP